MTKMQQQIQDLILNLLMSTGDHNLSVVIPLNTREQVELSAGHLIHVMLATLEIRRTYNEAVIRNAPAGPAPRKTTFCQIYSWYWDSPAIIKEDAMRELARKFALSYTALIPQDVTTAILEYAISLSKKKPRSEISVGVSVGT